MTAAGMIPSGAIPAKAGAIALALLLLAAPAAQADSRCTKTIFTRPCKDVRVETIPAGAVVTFTDRWGDQTCTSPCAVPLRWGEEANVSARLGGAYVGAEEPPRVRWVMRGMWGKDALGLEPNPVVLTLSAEPRGFFQRILSFVLRRGPRDLVIPAAK